jgi:hypothetical protein
VCLLLILSNKLDLNQETCFTIKRFLSLTDEEANLIVVCKSNIFLQFEEPVLVATLKQALALLANKSLERKARARKSGATFQVLYSWVSSWH